MNKKWLVLLNKDIRIWTKHGVYRGIFCGVMNNRLYCKSVRIGWVSMPELDNSKISGVIKRRWPLDNIVKIEIIGENGKYEEVKIN